MEDMIYALDMVQNKETQVQKGPIHHLLIQIWIYQIKLQSDLGADSSLADLNNISINNKNIEIHFIIEQTILFNRNRNEKPF